jgi:hypothetical protein
VNWESGLVALLCPTSNSIPLCVTSRPNDRQWPKGCYSWYQIHSILVVLLLLSQKSVDCSCNTSVEWNRVLCCDSAIALDFLVIPGTRRAICGGFGTGTLDSAVDRRSGGTLCCSLSRSGFWWSWCWVRCISRGNWLAGLGLCTDVAESNTLVQVRGICVGLMYSFGFERLNLGLMFWIEVSQNQITVRSAWGAVNTPPLSHRCKPKFF